MEEEKSVRNYEVVVKNVVEPNKSDIAEPLEKVDRKDEVEDRTNDEQVRSTETDLTGEKELHEGLGVVVFVFDLHVIFNEKETASQFRTTVSEGSSDGVKNFGDDVKSSRFKRIPIRFGGATAS
ncbi:hypothetical protein Tco_1210761 [Tanacetum coccineum]